MFDEVTQRCVVDGQTAAALKFGDPRVMALLHAIMLFFLLPEGFSNALLREQVARLLGKAPGEYKQGQMTYDLRRLRLHGIIERIPSTHRYCVPVKGLRLSLFFTKVHSRVLRGGLSQLFDQIDAGKNRPMVIALNKMEKAIDEHIQYAKIAA